ncbi:efflux transporter, outer membrane factor (OMF) lipoprotein, NodT family [Pseudomonas pohangensis]|uniref:Efflux transporter, outer membrane factor (OMF) lipoprotein, NodT family n=1 Tax=Pseudomonas pohangensis TaxID=364197 RepID=A0A1H2I4M9_9PSED|nr:TolC family protein [Pseudomonas pohangensis]SDU39093.1 efflux transporter, outer membrane factor (OMF) lipoprotein, NodT family [Pseudomonas pohangensis]
MKTTDKHSLPGHVLRPAVCVLLLLLGGCLSEPPQRDVILDQALPATPQMPAQWLGNAQATRISPQALQMAGNGWLDAFADPQLNSVVQAALENNPDLRVAASQVAIAAANVNLVGSQLMPQIGVGANKNWTKDFGQSNEYRTNQVSAGVSWELDIWGRLRAEEASAEAAYQASALDYAYARQSLVATTVKSWYRVVEAYKLLQLAEESQVLYADILKLVKIRMRAGKVSDFDVSQTQAYLDNIETQVQTAEKNYAEARRTLELLLGRYPAGDIQTTRMLANLPPVIASDTPVSIIARRPDVLAAEQQVISAFRLNEADRLALLPGFSLSLNAGRYTDGLLDALNLEPWLGTAGLGMQLPIYEGGALRANIRISDEYQKQAVANYGRVVLRALNEVESGLIDEYFYDRAILATDQAVQQRKRSVTIAKQRYQAGASDMLTVLQLQSQQLGSEASAIEQRFLRLSNWVNLNLALGQSYNQQPLISATAENQQVQ